MKQYNFFFFFFFFVLLKRRCPMLSSSNNYISKNLIVGEKYSHVSQETKPHESGGYLVVISIEVWVLSAFGRKRKTLAPAYPIKSRRNVLTVAMTQKELGDRTSLTHWPGGGLLYSMGPHLSLHWCSFACRVINTNAYKLLLMPLQF